MLTDHTRPFVIVLVEAPPRLPRALLKLMGKLTSGVQHLGGGCASRAEIDRLCAEARREGWLRSGPRLAAPGRVLGLHHRPARCGSARRPG